MSERARKQDGEKDSFVFFRDKSYIGWEGLFLGSQSDLRISSLMRVLIKVLMMIYVYRMLDESIHYKTLNPERLYCVMLNPGWLHSFQKPFVYNTIKYYYIEHKFYLVLIKKPKTTLVLLYHILKYC